MGAGLRLDGSMIPRRVRRMFDQRGEARAPSGLAAEMVWRGETSSVIIENLSPSGAMAVSDAAAHIGEAVILRLAEGQAIRGDVRWLRAGRIGIHFIAPLQ